MPTSEIQESFLRLKSQEIEHRLGPARFRILLYLIDWGLSVPKIAGAIGLRPFEVVCMQKILAPLGPKVLRELRDMVPRSPVRLITFSANEKENAA
jgi:hypothetical protein